MKTKVSKFLILAIVLLLVLTVIFICRSDKTGKQTLGNLEVNTVSTDKMTPYGIPDGHGMTEKPADPAVLGSVDLFLNNPAASLSSSESAIRVRTAQINKDGIDSLSEGETLRLNLFDDVDCDARINDSYTDVNGARVVTGTIDVDDAKGYLYMSTVSGKTTAFVDIPSEDRIFSAGSENGVDYSIFEHDTKKLDVVRTEKDSLSRKMVKFNSAGQLENADYQSPENFSASPDASSSDAVMDLMIAYTPAARKWAASNYQGPIENIMAIAVARANTAFANSKTGARLKIVHSQEINYVAAGEAGGSSSADLNSITFSEAVQSLRNKYGADIVTLVTACDDIGGLGWLYCGDSSFAFNLCRVKQLANSYTLAHECGHNMGCGHSKTQLGNAPGYFLYSAGWQWIGRNGKGYHTVMTYGSAAHPMEVPFFSNPSILYGGNPTGDSRDADNSRTIINLKHRVSSFRPTTND
ncbi:MAG: M12 family metallo-peptidase [Lentisphaerae bacterium]|nr:M12 family metallo-peptidase [Lentisphaerota bacterium]